MSSFAYTYRFANTLPLDQVTNSRIRQQGFNSLTSNVITVGILGIDNALTNAEVVYPNPVSNQLNLNSPNPTGFAVYDLAGKLVDRVLVVKKQYTIDTSRWSSKIYFIQLDANPSNVYKVVK